MKRGWWINGVATMVWEICKDDVVMDTVPKTDGDDNRAEAEERMIALMADEWAGSRKW